MEKVIKQLAVNPLRNINRIDIASTNQHGWQVRSQMGGRDRSWWFSDAKCGSPAHGLAMALDQRDAMLSILSK